MQGFMLYCYRSRDDYYYNPKGQKIKKQVGWGAVGRG